MVQAVQQSSYYVGLQRNPGMPLMGLQLPGMQPAPMHAPVMGLQYRPAYGQGAPVQSVVSADGSTLRLRGLPYSAGVEEIADFFTGRGFRLRPTTSFVQLPEQCSSNDAAECTFLILSCRASSTALSANVVQHDPCRLIGTVVYWMAGAGVSEGIFHEVQVTASHRTAFRW